MNNKQQIQKLRDNAELAMASYGYFHLIGKKFKNDSIYKGRENTEITLYDILDLTYKDYVTTDHTMLINPEYLNGDFTPTQAKRFFERYDLLIHQPNTESGFSATLFQHQESNKYTLAIRGTEIKLSQAWQDIITTDGSLLLSSTPLEQYNDMLRFYNQCKTKYPAMTESKSLNIAGHSLGGALTQMLTLSLCDDTNEANINEVYTFNSHLESKKVV